MEARTMKKTLAERIAEHEAKKQRLAQQGARLKDAERRARTRQLIELGGIVMKSGLADMPANELLGALLDAASRADQPGIRNNWSVRGGRAFQHEKEQREAAKAAE
jgi:Conjugal transfer protein TraD